MAKRAKFVPVKTAEGWRINIPPRYSESGRRERHFYRTRKEANEASEKLRQRREAFGEQARAIAPSLANEAHAAVKLLEPLGVGLLEAVRRFVDEEKRMRASEVASVAFEDFLRTREGLSERQFHAYELARNHFVAAFGERPLASLTGPELVHHLESVTGGPASYNHRARLIRAFWRWCAKEPREWCRATVVDHLEPKKTVRQPIGVLYTEECRKLLHTAEEHFPECVAGFALSLFAGIRQSELKRLDPEDFTDEGFVVSAVESTKVRHRRFIQITPTLEAWLKDYPITETVLPSNWDRKSKAVRRLAGWRVWSDLVPRMDFDPPLEESPPESLPEWPDNALRHTHASVAIATGKPLENLIFEFGHSGGVKTLKSHYVGVMPKKVALEILALGPKGTKVKSIRVA